uniref:BED-type domain-containing protein n=1 Tax=Meloidogyne hapla TaxID=6305 RepID=A0A1I8BE88_MELHA
MSKRKSTVWEYYEIDDEDKNGNRNAECKECKRKIKFYKTTTSSLHKHLKTHGIIINRIKKETKNMMVCLFCSKTVSAISSRTDHYKSFKCGYQQFYSNTSWSESFNRIIEKNEDVPIKELEAFLKKEEGKYTIYLVRQKEDIKGLVYIGMTGRGEFLGGRLKEHYRKGTFDDYKEVEVAILFEKLSKKQSEILEGVLILISNKNLLNAQFEVRNLQQLDNKEVFHERVKRFHEMAIQMMKNRWNSIKWTKCETRRKTPKTTPTTKRVYNELLIELEKEKKKSRKLEEKSNFNKTMAVFYRERALNVKRNVENFKEGKEELNASYNSWSSGTNIPSLNNTFNSENKEDESSEDEISEDETIQDPLQSTSGSSSDKSRHFTKENM